MVIVKPNRVVKKGEQITPYGLSAKAYYLSARNLKVRGFVLFSPRPLWVFMRFKSIRLLPSLIVTNVHEKVWYLPCRPYSASIVIVAEQPLLVNSKNKHLFVENRGCRKFTTPCFWGKLLAVLPFSEAGKENS